jgi:hypothetical protein
MSWGFSTKGTKAGARAQIASMKNWATPDSEEFKVSEGARAALLALIDGAPLSDCSLVVVTANVAGHGSSVTSMTFGLEYVMADPPAQAPAAAPAEDRPKPPDPTPPAAT